jgi:hypothetical protein
LTLVLDGYVGSRYEGNLRAVVAPPETAAVRPGPWDPALEPDGHQEFGPFPPGDYVLSLWMGPYAPFLERRLTLASGPRELHLALPPIYVLDVRIEGPEGDQGFYLERLDGPAGYAAPRVVDGRFLRFEGLVAGEYVLSRHHGPRQHMPLTITGDRVVTFKPIVLDAMRVTVADPEGPLARGGFVDGDLVLAIDGTEIRGETQGYGLLRLAVARGSGTFSLVRGGKRRDVEVRLPEEVLDPAKAGGEIRPWTR